MAIFKLANGILLQLFISMLKNTNYSDEESKASSLPFQKHQLVPKNQIRCKTVNKENNENLQLKRTLLARQKKQQNNFLAMRETFAIYSKVHLACLTKFHTLFLAFHLYELAISDASLKHVPQPYKSLCCMYIAMKYEQIYPVELSELAKYLRISYKLDDYRRHQKAILVSIGMNLDFQTIDRTIEAYYPQLDFVDIEESICSFLLELAFTSQRIYRQFEEAEICKAIIMLVKGQGVQQCQTPQKKEDQQKIMKYLVEARSADRGLENQIVRKYRSGKYSYVPMPIARCKG